MGTLRVELFHWVIQQPAMLSATNGVTPVAFARNEIVENFLKTDLKYLMMVDSDTVPGADALEKLLSVVDDNTVATGITPILKNGKKCVNVYKKTTDVEECVENFDDSDPFKVEGCGASCLLIPRTLLEKMERPYFKSIEFDDGKICSEDLYFCDKVREVGDQIICHPEVVCTHFKEIGFSLTGSRNSSI